MTEASDPDLFWAFRGGGGNFGIATAFTYRLHPLEHDHRRADRAPDRGGRRSAPLLSGRGRELPGRPHRLRRTRPCPRWLGDEVVCDGRVPHGRPEQAERDLEPFKTWGSPLMVEVGRMPYAVMNTILDGGHPRGSNYWLSSFTRGMPDGLIDTMVERYRVGAVADDRAPARALPRRGDPGRRDRHRRPSPRRRLEPADSRRLARSRRDRGEHRVDA